MVRFAELIQKIRSHPSQGDEPIFFLCENVVMKLEDSQAFEPIFGISPVEICAQQMSPAKRSRGYFTNVSVSLQIALSISSHSQCFMIERQLPVNELPEPDSDAAVSTINLTDGWMHPAQLHCLINNESTQLYCKAHTFLASAGIYICIKS